MVSVFTYTKTVRLIDVQHLRTTSMSHDVRPVSSLPGLLGSLVRQMRSMLPYIARNVLMFALVRRLEVEPAERVAVNKALLLHCPDVEHVMVPAFTPPSVNCHTSVSVPFAPSHVTSLLDESMSTSIKLDWHCRRLKPADKNVAH